MSQIQYYLERIYRLLCTFDISLGVDVRERELVLVRVKKTLMGYVVLETLRIPKNPWDYLPNVLYEAVEKYNLNSNYVMFNVPGEMVLQKKVRIPAMDAADIPAYLAENSEIILPSHLEKSGMSVQYKIVDTSNGHTTLVVFLYRRRDLEQYYISISEFEPLQIVYDGFCQDAISEQIKPEFTGFVLEAAIPELVMHGFRNGHWIGCRQIELPEQAGVVNSDGLQRAIAADFDVALTSEYLLCQNGRDGQAINNILTQQGWRAVETTAPFEDPVYWQAYALALKPFISREDALDMLPKPAAQQLQQDFHRQLTTRSVLVLGGAILVIALLFYAFQSVLLWQYGTDEAERLALEPFIQTRDSLVISQTALLQSVENYTQLTGERTQIAYYLYKLSETLPAQAWYHRVVLEENGESEILVRLHGLALREKEVSGWLKRLEALPFARNIVLDEMTTHSGKAVRRKWKLRYHKLIEFRVHLNVRV